MDKATFQYTPASSTYPMAEVVDETALPNSRGQPGMPSTVITIPTYSPQPKDYILWSIFNTVYLNTCCLGFLALVFSVKARDRKVMGDMTSASSYGSTSKCLNITALLLSVLFTVVFIVLIITGKITIRGYF